ncbi:hypothetical protein PENSPDRAFT_667551 [Peniophora sp. CONT]|nr:hypothetical protein PENSPDRAFT_667551 [Peniophora sp. CONT]
MSTSTTNILTHRFTHPSRTRHYRLDLTTPNPNPPPAMELDIDPADGYVLIARGELAKVNETFLPAPPSEIECPKWEKPVRFSMKRPLQPRRCSLSKSKNYRLGSISPTCSGTRFPDYPSADSPASVRKEFDDFVKQIEARNAVVTPSKKNDVAAILSVRPGGSRHPSIPARRPAAAIPVIPKIAMPVPSRAERIDIEDDLQSEAPSSGPSTPNDVTEFGADIGLVSKNDADLGVELDSDTSLDDASFIVLPLSRRSMPFGLAPISTAGSADFV